MRSGTLSGWAKEVFSKTSWLVFCGFILAVGFSCGVFLPKYIAAAERQSYISFTVTSVAQTAAGGISLKTLGSSLWNNIRLIAAIMVCGYAWPLIPAGTIALAVKGFGMGVFMYGVSAGFGIKGLLIGMIYLLPQSILFFLGYITLLKAAIINSTAIFPRITLRWHNSFHKTAPSIYAIIAGSVVECFISIFLLKLLL